MKDFYQQLQKAELHLHLDGSLRPKTLLDLAWKQNIVLPYSSVSELKTALCFQRGWDLPRCLQSFSTTLSVLQTPESLERVAYELCEDLVRDGVTYAEIRYCPSLHTKQSLSLGEVPSLVGKGLTRAQVEFGIRAKQIITCLRNLGPSHAEEMVSLAISSVHYGVVGVDLAGNEYEFPPEDFAQIFQYARSHGLHVTIHAGEGNTPQTTKNIRTSLEENGAERIGHGVAASLDEDLLNLLVERGITVEVCLTSNIHTGSIKDYKNHPARTFYDRGIVIIPCADNTFLSQTTTSREYRHLAVSNGFTKKELRSIAKQSFTVSFSGGVVNES